MANFGVFGKMPSIEELQNPSILQASEVYADDGTLMGKYYYENGNRSIVKYRDISQHVIDALIATEEVEPRLGWPAGPCHARATDSILRTAFQPVQPRRLNRSRIGQRQPPGFHGGARDGPCSSTEAPASCRRATDDPRSA